MYDDCLYFALEGYGAVTVNPSYKHERVLDLRNRLISNKEKVASLLKQTKKFTYKSFVAKQQLYEEYLRGVESLIMTDYSASSSIPKLLDHIVTVSSDWIGDLRSKTPKRPKSALLENFYRQREITFQELFRLFKEIGQVKKSLKGKFELNKKLRGVLEHAHHLSPGIHDKNEFQFSLGEFLIRTMRSLMGTY